MDKQLDFGSFLASQTAEGKVDSQGEFTIAHDQAASKLAKFALPRTSAWVSKLVQAAVGWNCKKIQVRQSVGETIFHFTMASLQHIPTEEAIVSHILSGKIGQQEPIEAFCLGLRAIVEQAQLSFILVASDGDITPRPIYAGRHYSDLSEQERLSSRYRPLPGLSLTISHDLPNQPIGSVIMAYLGSLSSTEIVKELDAYCYTCPLPIILDGRRIDSLIQSPSLKFTATNRPIAFLGVRGNLEYSPKLLPLPEDFETKLPSLLTHPRRLARSYRGDHYFQAVFILSFSLDSGDSVRHKTSRLLWINKGVVVEEELLNVSTLGVSLSIFANADSLPTDLTGFSLSKLEEWERRRSEIFYQVAQELQNSQISLGHLFSPDEDGQTSDDRAYDEELNTQKRIRRIVKGSGAGIALTLVNPILGVPTTLGTIITTYAAKPFDMKTFILSLRPRIEKRITSDLRTLKYYLAETSSQETS